MSNLIGDIPYVCTLCPFIQNCTRPKNELTYVFPNTSKSTYMYKISSNLNINTEHEKYTTGTKFRMHVNGSHIYITKKGPNARDASLIHDFEQ